MGRRIVITGAAGNVGRTVTEALEGRHTLALMDRTTCPGREVIRVELSDFAAVLDRMPEADAVVHLGANPDEAAWQDILTNNIVATYNVFEVARRKGVRRIVFASTVIRCRRSASGSIGTCGNHPSRMQTMLMPCSRAYIFPSSSPNRLLTA